MPWYNENLDSDLEEELDHREITNGKFLDLGTGPATQAMWLAKRGFNVTGSDLSEAAIKRARTVYANEKENVNFVVDDIINSNLKDNEFDYIFDRGCFHVLLPTDRQRYITKIKQILKDNGIFLGLPYRKYSIRYATIYLRILVSFLRYLYDFYCTAIMNS